MMKLLFPQEQQRTMSFCVILRGNRDESRRIATLQIIVIGVVPHSNFV
jgi:hypothetical protein